MLNVICAFFMDNYFMLFKFVDLKTPKTKSWIP